MNVFFLGNNENEWGIFSSGVAVTMIVFSGITMTGFIHG